MSQVQPEAPQKDDWHHVTDPKKRKQIQDRLAQRARRRRLAETRPEYTPDGSNPVPLTLGIPDNIVENGSTASHASERTAFSTISIGLLGGLPVVTARKSSSSTTILPTLVDEHELNTSCMSIQAALLNNGRLLGLKCANGKPIRSKSTFSCDGIPEQLWPTILQRSVEHPQWVDRFPFPFMRDTWIQTMDSIDEEEFLEDLLITTVSFVVKKGYESWDAEGWAITNDFKLKWGYLFFP